MRQMIFIAVAGALGAVSRYALSSAANRLTGGVFPFGTLLVNTAGSLLIGYIMYLGISTDIIPPIWRITLTVGFLGAFTTFSSFSYETVMLIQESEWILAAANIAANVLLCLIAATGGMALGRLTLGAPL